MRITTGFLTGNLFSDAAGVIEGELTMLTAHETVITSRARNLGYGWRTDAAQTPQGLRIRDVTLPDVVGGLRSIEAEIARRRRICGTDTWYREALFVAGRRVTHVKDVDGEWVEVGGGRYTVPMIVEELRAGGAVTVRLAPAEDREE